MTLAERGAAALYGAAWRTVRALPERCAYELFDLIADVAWWRRGTGLQRLEFNLARVLTWRDGRPPDVGELRRHARLGMRSYLRYWCDVFRLPGWSAARIEDTVTLENDAQVRAILASGRGVVGALGHLGNWDHAGAWSEAHLAHVVTVAERLRPPEVFEQFLSFRQSLGMEILALDPRGEPREGAAVVRVLSERLRGGAFVPLLCDRDLTERGVPVRWFGHAASMAGGPASLACGTGAALIPITVRYRALSTRRGAGRGTGARQPAARWGIVVTFWPEVPQAGGTRRERVADMTQQVADRLAVAVAAAPQDWHMLQRVFLADLPAPGVPVPGVTSPGVTSPGVTSPGVAAPAPGAA